MLESPPSHVGVAGLRLQVPVVHVRVARPHQHDPPLPVLLGHDSPSNVKGGPGHVGDLGPGVGPGAVVVGLRPGVGAVVTSKHVEPLLDTVHHHQVPVYGPGVGGPALPAGPGGGDPVVSRVTAPVVSAQNVHVGTKTLQRPVSNVQYLTKKVKRVIPEARVWYSHEVYPDRVLKVEVELLARPAVLSSADEEEVVEAGHDWGVPHPQAGYLVECTTPLVSRHNIEHGRSSTVPSPPDTSGGGNNDKNILKPLTDILLLSGGAVEAADVVDAGLCDLGRVPDVPHLVVLNIPVLSTKPHPLGLDKVVAGVDPRDDVLLKCKSVQYQRLAICSPRYHRDI